MMDASPGLGCKAQVTSTVVGIDASEKVGSPVLGIDASEEVGSPVVGIDASEKVVSPASEEPGRGCRAYLVWVVPSVSEPEIEG